jgi:hypothetical protein
MSVMVANCPRCAAVNMTFDVLAQTRVLKVTYTWQRWFEVFGICRQCHVGTIFGVKQKNTKDEDWIRNANGLVEFKHSLNNAVEVDYFVNISHFYRTPSPQYVPEHIARIFDEGAAAVAISCWNAAGTMFRLCVDLATVPLLPEGEVEGFNNKIRRDLGLRLPWLFDRGLLPDGLRDLSQCIREDGNDAAHKGTLAEADARDILDFTEALLTRLYTEPIQIELAKLRREQRRTPAAN